MKTPAEVRGFPGLKNETWDAQRLSWIEVSHPFAKCAKGWGTQIAWRIRCGAGAALALAAPLLLILSGCGHQQTVAELPAPQAAPPQTQASPAAPQSKPSPSRIAPTPAPPGGG